ncbi:MAG TPA: hypothetical protein VIC26_04715 [Marinagarivorans sp.]
MKRNYSVLASCLLAWVWLANTAIADYRAAPALDAMQRMQGQWQRHCHPSWDGDTRVYRRDFLSVDFTHLAFESKVYTDSDCRTERTQYSARLRYLLPGEFFDVDGQKAFVLNAQWVQGESRFFRFPLLNIVAIGSGKLYFGRDYSGEPEAGHRLKRLDVASPFIRH